jgi:hypothetical protein
MLPACKRVRRKTHFASGLKQFASSGPIPQKILLSFLQKSWFAAAVPPHHEGRFAIVTNVEAGCGGRI